MYFFAHDCKSNFNLNLSVSDIYHFGEYILIFNNQFSEKKIFDTLWTTKWKSLLSKSGPQFCWLLIIQFSENTKTFFKEVRFWRKKWFPKLETLQPNIHCHNKEIKCTFSNRTEDSKAKKEHESSIENSSIGKSESEFDNQDFRQEKDDDMPIYKVVLVYPHGNFTVFSNTPIIGAQVDSELPMSFLKKLKNSKECSEGG